MAFLCLRQFMSVTPGSVRSMSHAVLALGGNVGDVESTFREALVALGRNGVQVKRTSNLYCTPAMHVTDQRMFLNAAVCVETCLSVHQLLQVAKTIEKVAGRDFGGQRWGPRPLDIDIIFSEEGSVATADLTVPHPRWQDRAFVCRPVLDLCTPEAARLPWWGQVCTKVREVMKKLPVDDLQSIRPTWALKAGICHTMGSRTLVMGIMNVTDDSFSDGGTVSLAQIEERVGKMLEDGADIVDVGGQSTRPGAMMISASEEAARVGPVIERIGKMDGIILSVDTFYADVARAAIRAGAHIVNDVTAGLGDTSMHKTVAELQVPYILMHSRGGPEDFHHPKRKEYCNLEEEIASEITQAANSAMQAGVPAWQLMLDVGVGFSKGPADSMRLVTSSATIRQHLPGHGIPADRDYATVAANTLAIAGGADVIRVHHVRAGVDAARVADAALRHPRHSMFR